MALFSVIVFGAVVWTIAVSGAKQLRFRLKTRELTQEDGGKTRDCAFLVLRDIFIRHSACCRPESYSRPVA